MTRPIVLKEWEVRGILEGRITQLRRPVKFPKTGEETEWDGCPLKGFPYIFTAWEAEYPEEGSFNIESPFGPPGTILWGKETWGIIPSDKFDVAVYKCGWDRVTSWRWQSPATMPRWASRITLENLGVRVEKEKDVWAWVLDFKRREA